jgi:hypothetical protein
VTFLLVLESFHHFVPVFFYRFNEGHFKNKTRCGTKWENHKYKMGEVLPDGPLPIMDIFFPVRAGGFCGSIQF